MDDSWLPSFIMASQGVGAGVSAVGAYGSAQGQQASLNAAAGFDDINAGIAERTAQAALLAGQSQEQQIRQRTAQLKSKQVANMAANGVDLGTKGSAAVLTSTDVLGDIDANTSHANSVRAAWGYRTQATNYANDALTKRAAADSLSPILSATTSLIGSAGSVASSWYKLDQAGAWSTSPSGGNPNAYWKS